MVKIIATILLLYLFSIAYRYLQKQISLLVIITVAVPLVGIVLVWLLNLMWLLGVKIIEVEFFYNTESFALSVIIFGLFALLGLKLLASMRNSTKYTTDLIRNLSIERAIKN